MLADVSLIIAWPKPWAPGAARRTFRNRPLDPSPHAASSTSSVIMVARLTLLALGAIFAFSHAFVALPLPRAHASRAVGPSMLFGGGGKEGEGGGGNMNMMETIKKAQQARAPAPDPPR